MSATFVVNLFDLMGKRCVKSVKWQEDDDDDELVPIKQVQKVDDPAG